MKTKNKLTLSIAVHPGGILQEELEARGIKKKDFARQLEIEASNLSAILHGKRDISKELAIKLEKLLGIPARTWIELQNDYYFDKKEIELRKLQSSRDKTELEI